MWGAVERVESLAGEVLQAWRMAGNLNYRQARQEAHQISGRNLLPGLPVIHIYSLTLVVPKTGNELR